MDAVIEKWEEILQTVKSEYEVTDVPFNTWLKPLKVYEVDGNLITVAVPSEQAGIGVNYITKRYKIPLQVTICVLTGMEECEVQFVLEKDLLKKEEEKKYGSVYYVVKRGNCPVHKGAWFQPRKA